MARASDLRVDGLYDNELIVYFQSNSMSTVVERGNNLGFKRYFCVSDPGRDVKVRFESYSGLCFPSDAGFENLKGRLNNARESTLSE